MTAPNFDSADVPNGGEQFRSVRHGFVIVLGFAGLNTVDVIGQVEEQVVIEGHVLGTPRRATKFRHLGSSLRRACGGTGGGRL
jgi:hypothetical protein